MKKFTLRSYLSYGWRWHINLGARQITSQFAVKGQLLGLRMTG